MEELVKEILVRIPPDEPAYLVSAALVCKDWHRILSNHTASSAATASSTERRPCSATSRTITTMAAHVSSPPQPPPLLLWLH